MQDIIDTIQDIMKHTPLWLKIFSGVVFVMTIVLIILLLVLVP